ncbi:MAG: hypothetical protein WKG07_21570 [Hymenobacter sp.]
MAVIINLAMVAWEARPPTRSPLTTSIYRPRQLPAYPFGAPAAQPLRNGLFREPHLAAPNAATPTAAHLGADPAPGRAVAPGPARQPEPALRLHPTLPTGPDWQAPWLVGLNTSPIEVRWWPAPSPCAGRCSTRRAARGSRARPPRPLAAPLTGLPPARTRCARTAGAAECTQPVFVLDRPANSQPTASWLQPVPATP